MLEDALGEKTGIEQIDVSPGDIPHHQQMSESDLGGPRNPRDVKRSSFASKSARDDFDTKKRPIKQAWAANSSQPDVIGFGEIHLSGTRGGARNQPSIHDLKTLAP